MLPESAQRTIDEIRHDNTSGAVDLTQRAARLLPELEDPAELEIACREITQAQPAMASIVNLANAVLYASERGEDIGALCNQYAEALATAGERIGRHLVELLEDGATILTHSSSRTVLDALRSAAEMRPGLRIICTESRPMNEGAALARLLHEAGHSVTLIADASMYRVMDRVELAVTGADAITSHGVVNKIGTTMLALAARECGRQTYVLCGSQKFLPVDYERPEEPPRPASELLADPSSDLTVDNRYFETTPFPLITGVVIEEGILDTTNLGPWLDVTLHPALLSRKSS